MEHDRLLVVVIARDRVDYDIVCFWPRNRLLLILLCCGALRLLDPLLLQALDWMRQILLVYPQCLDQPA